MLASFQSLGIFCLFCVALFVCFHSRKYMMHASELSNFGLSCFILRCFVFTAEGK